MPTFLAPNHKNLLLGFPEFTIQFTDGVLIADDKKARIVRSHSSFNTLFFEKREKSATQEAAPPVEAGSGEKKRRAPRKQKQEGVAHESA